MKNNMHHENDPEENVQLSIEDRMKLTKEIRMGYFPENLVNALAKECAFELKNYPGVRYTGAELGTIKEFVLNHLDEVLNKLVNTQTEGVK